MHLQYNRDTPKCVQRSTQHILVYVLYTTGVPVSHIQLGTRGRRQRRRRRRCIRHHIKRYTELNAVNKVYMKSVSRSPEKTFDAAVASSRDPPTHTSCVCVCVDHIAFLNKMRVSVYVVLLLSWLHRYMFVLLILDEDGL